MMGAGDTSLLILWEVETMVLNAPDLASGDVVVKVPGVIPGQLVRHISVRKRFDGVNLFIPLSRASDSSDTTANFHVPRLGSLLIKSCNFSILVVSRHSDKSGKVVNFFEGYWPKGITFGRPCRSPVVGILGPGYHCPPTGCMGVMQG